MFAPGGVVAVAAARWNGPIVGKLMEGCETRLAALGATAAVFRVAGGVRAADGGEVGWPRVGQVSRR